MTNNSEPQHIPVLAQEAISLLELRSGGVYVDATLGLGGHSEQILSQPLKRPSLLIGLDRDIRALEFAKRRLEHFGDQFVGVYSNFSDIDKQLETLGVPQVDGILADFGVSSYQLDTAERGFSFNRPGPLDMRMDAGLDFTALDMIHQLSEEKLAHLIWTYGDERFSRRIAKKMKEFSYRQLSEMSTVDLAQVISKIVPRSSKKIHPATKTFQALRIAVNDELQHIETFLKKAILCLAPLGRLVCISFHALEDRIVKQFFREQAVLKNVKLLTKKPIIPSVEECQYNPRSRSAKMRGLVRLENV